MIQKLFLFLSALPFVLTAQEKPNIVFMLVDDMGYADLGCYGAPDTTTPNLDQLAANGVKFTQFYANGAECSPSRTAILTGRYPQRVGGLECAIGTGNVGRYDDAIALAEQSQLGLPASHATLAPNLKQAGYATAVFGKWHMGYEPEFNPLHQGFDEFRGFLGGNVDYYQHKELSPIPVLLNGTEIDEREGYMTELITDDAIDFISRRSAEKSPFFLYVAWGAPHFPFQPPNADPGQMHPEETWTTGTRETYVSMINHMDSEVGRILTALQESGVSGNTIVVFASDHGGMKPAFNTPFRDFKGTLFEGGIRVPCIAHWPGKLEGGQVLDEPGTLMDWTATWLTAAGCDLSGLNLDGTDIFHVLEQQPERTFFWRARRGERTWKAVRQGTKKFVQKTEEGEVLQWSFDLAADPSEEEELPVFTELETLLKQWEQDVKASRP